MGIRSSTGGSGDARSPERASLGISLRDQRPWKGFGCILVLRWKPWHLSAHGFPHTAPMHAGSDRAAAMGLPTLDPKASQSCVAARIGPSPQGFSWRPGYTSPQATARCRRWLRVPRRARCRGYSSKAAPGKPMAPCVAISASTGASSIARCDASDAAIHGLGRQRLCGLVRLENRSWPGRQCGLRYCFWFTGAWTNCLPCCSMRWSPLRCASLHSHTSQTPRQLQTTNPGTAQNRNATKQAAGDYGSNCLDWGQSNPTQCFGLRSARATMTVSVHMFH